MAHGANANLARRWIFDATDARDRVPDKDDRAVAETVPPKLALPPLFVPVGEDVSERLEVVPAEFFVHRHIRGKWTSRCCSGSGEGRLVQEPVDPQIIDKGVPTASLLAHRWKPTH